MNIGAVRYIESTNLCPSTSCKIFSLNTKQDEKFDKQKYTFLFTQKTNCNKLTTHLITIM